MRFRPDTDGGFLRRCRIRFNSYFCLESVQGQGARGRDTAWSHSIGCAVKLAGTNIFVEDNDIFSSGDVVSTRDNGAAGATYMQIARNRFFNGGTTHWGISWKQCAPGLEKTKHKNPACILPHSRPSRRQIL